MILQEVFYSDFISYLVNEKMKRILLGEATNKNMYTQIS